MEAYRLSREKFAGTLSGKGAAIKGARWNSIGIEMIYTAANRSVAMAEVAIHFTIATLPDGYVMLTVFIPNSISMQKLDTRNLPAGWNLFPHLLITQSIGDQFITENKYCVFQVPSVVTQGDYTLLINPNHADFKSIKIIATEKFPFNQRLFV